MNQKQSRLLISPQVDGFSFSRRLALRDPCEDPLLQQ